MRFGPELVGVLEAEASGPQQRQVAGRRSSRTRCDRRCRARMSGPAADAATISGPGWSGATSPMAAGIATPSPMVGSSSAGQQRRASPASRAGSVPSGDTAYRRLLPASPVAPSSASTDAPSPMLSGSRYCSCAPMTISGRPSPVRSASAGVATSSPPSPTPESAVNVTLCGARVDRLHLGRVDEQHREPVDGGAVVVPGVEVPVERGGDDLERPVAVEVAERGLRREAGLGAVELVLRGDVVLGERRGRRSSSPAGLRWRPTTRTPCRSMSVATTSIVAVAVEIADRRRADAEGTAVRVGWRPLAAAGEPVGHHGRRRRRTGKPASSDRPGPRKAWIAPSSVAEQQLVPAVAVEVDERRARRCRRRRPRWGSRRTRSGSSCTKTCFCISPARPSPAPPCAVTTTRRRTAKRSSSGRPVGRIDRCALAAAGQRGGDRREVERGEPAGGRLAQPGPARRRPCHVSMAGYAGGWRPGAHSTR